MMASRLSRHALSASLSNRIRCSRGTFFAGLALATGFVLSEPSALANGLFHHKQRVLLVESAAPAPVATTSRTVVRYIIRESTQPAAAAPDPAPTPQTPAKAVTPQPQAAAKDVDPAPTVIHERVIIREVAAPVVTERVVVVREVQSATQVILVKPKHHWKKW